MLTSLDTIRDYLVLVRDYLVSVRDYFVSVRGYWDSVRGCLDPGRCEERRAVLAALNTTTDW